MSENGNDYQGILIERTRNLEKEMMRIYNDIEKLSDALKLKADKELLDKLEKALKEMEEFIQDLKAKDMFQEELEEKKRKELENKETQSNINKNILNMIYAILMIAALIVAFLFGTKNKSTKDKELPKIESRGFR